MADKITPWVDVSWCQCGCLAEGSGFYYRGIIEVLKKNTKKWKHFNGGYYCPSCAKEYLEQEDYNGLS